MTWWFHPEALAGYREAALRYKQVKPQLGRDFRNTIEKAITIAIRNIGRVVCQQVEISGAGARSISSCSRFSTLKIVRRHPFELSPCQDLR